MRCPECGTDTYVIDSRRHFRGETVRRRRCCWNDHRFTTYEFLVTRAKPKVSRNVAGVPA